MEKWRITPPSILLLRVFPSRTFFIPPRFIDGERRRRLERGSNGQCGSLGNLQYWVPATTSLCTSITFNRYSVTSSDIRSYQKKYKFAVLGPRLFPVSSITPIRSNNHIAWWNPFLSLDPVTTSPMYAREPFCTPTQPSLIWGCVKCR